MTKKKIVTLIAMWISLFMLSSCGSSAGGGNPSEKPESVNEKNSLEATTVIQETETLAEDHQDINGYRYGDYDIFDSYAKDNGLGDTKIYIDGILKEPTEKLKSMVADKYFVYLLEQEDGKQWMVFMGYKPIHSESLIKELVGKQVRVFAIYQGKSEKMLIPSVQMVNYTDRSSHIEEKETGKKYYNIDFVDDEENIMDWCDANNKNEVIYSQRFKKANSLRSEDFDVNNFLMTSSGMVQDVSEAPSTIQLIQRTKNGFRTQEVVINKFLKDSINIDYINGDKVKVYYLVDGDNTVVIGTRSTKLDFTESEVLKDYLKSFKGISFEKLARNPDRIEGKKVKVTGEVIQVLEEDDTIYLRVNITKSKYGIYKDTIFVEYTKESDDEDRILEDDIITIYGEASGLYSYESVTGSDVTLPYLVAEYIYRK